jgi:hypothetical protein
MRKNSFRLNRNWMGAIFFRMEAIFFWTGANSKVTDVAKCHFLPAENPFF